MALTVAVVSSELFAPRIRELSSEFSDIHFIYYTYKHSTEARAIASELPNVDAVFFAGTFPYYHAKAVLEEKEVPVYVMRQDEAVVTATLLQAGWLYHVSPSEISIDLTDPVLIHEIVEEISPGDALGTVLQIDPNISQRAVVQFHSHAQQSRKTKVAITSIHAVHEELIQKGYRSIYMRELKRTLARALAQTAYLARLTKSQKAEPAVMLISKQHADDPFNATIRRHVQGSWFPYNDDTVQFITTRKHVEHVLSQFEFREFLETSKARTGIGYGLDILTATRHAEDALDFSEEGGIYVMDAQKSLSSPLSSERITLQLTQPNQVMLAKQMGLSPANLSRLLRFYEIHPSNQFTAQDLETYLGVTRRSTERIIKKCVDHKLVMATGEEMTYQQGRPRTIYTFTLPDFLTR